MFGVGRALRAPVDLTRRALRLLDDVAALADRARRDPDPLEEALGRIDAALVEMRAGIAVLVELLAQTRELTHTTRSLERLAGEMTPRADAVTAVGERLEASAREVLQAEQALVECSRRVEARTGELLADGRRLTAISERIDTSLGAFATALPRLLAGLDTVEQLEGA